MLELVKPQDKQNFKEFCIKNYPNESCGLILSNYSIFICKNCADNPSRTFLIDPKDYLKASKNNKIIGIIHSHCSKRSQFSILDKQIAEDLQINSIIYNISADSFFEYTPNGTKNNYLNRSFHWGKRDCLSLVCDYYKNELNIDLYDVFPKRDANFFLNNKSFFNEEKYLQLIKDKGFTIIDKNSKLEIHDILFINTNDSYSFPNHLAIYIDENKILHQLRKSFSCIDSLSLEFQSRIWCIIRHNTFL